MVKAKTIYIFEGEDTISIARGLPLEPFETSRGKFYKTYLRFKGLFGRFVLANNIPEAFVGVTKKLATKDGVSEDWTVTRVKMDWLTMEPHAPDIEPKLLSRVESLRRDVGYWKNLYFDALNQIDALSGEQRYREKVRDDAKYFKDIKQDMVGYGGGWGGGFYDRWMSPGGAGGGQTEW